MHHLSLDRQDTAGLAGDDSDERQPMDAVFLACPGGFEWTANASRPTGCTRLGPVCGRAGLAELGRPRERRRGRRHLQCDLTSERRIVNDICSASMNRYICS